MTVEHLYYIFLFAFGSAVGSFLNVCIHRLPKNESIINPPSHCPKCNKRIAWYDNIPLVSYILLGAKCRNCKSRISFRYFMVELLTASLFMTLYWRFGFNPTYLGMAILCCGLLVATFVDFEYQIIPDEISIGGIISGLIFAVVYPRLLGETSHIAGGLKSLLGIVAGGGSIYITGLLGSMAFKKEAMGGGDVKLMAAIGAFLGWEMALLTFFLAPISGAIVGLISKIKFKQNVIPYGPFLSLSAVACIFWGRDILRYILMR